MTTRTLTMIGAGDRARALLAALPKDGRPGDVTDEGEPAVTLTAQRLTRLGTGSGWRRRYVLSGGVRITATVAAPKYGGSPTSFTTRLGPGWTRVTFLRVATHYYVLARRTIPLDRCRDEVYAAFGDAVPEAMIAAVEAASAETGHPTEYGAMSYEDCDYWLAWRRKAEEAAQPVPGGEEAPRP